MKLNDYLSLHDLSLRDFAKKAGVSAATVLRARDGKVIASRKTLQSIVDATSGQVGVADLIRLEGDEGKSGG
ncbi:helix-turn-helix domain-containing protein [Roseibium sp.]|uniref:helix-turn-helix domain-containing protein n=1 Tax=Roseibium sp. TaxID=1936156 RepID=UPI003BAD9E5A